MTPRARALRKRPTEEEELLWHALRNRNSGHKIRRQHPLGYRIVDFFCHEAQVAIEIDGDHHNEFFDEIRDVRFGVVKVLRFSNADVRANVFDVLAKIKRELDQRVLERSSALSPRTSAGAERGSGGEAIRSPRTSTADR